MQAPSSATLLRVWEAGRTRHPIDRAVLLHALAAPDAEPEALADEPLGRRNAALLVLRQRTFGRGLRATAACRGCDEMLEFELDAAALLPPPSELEAPVEVDGQRFRLPTSRDLSQILGDADVQSAALHLLRLCRVAPDGPIDDARLVQIMELVEARLEQADPFAELQLDLPCECCGRSWSTLIDVAGFLWEEIEAYARRLLDEVHELARAYGWSEAEILGLSDTRRAAYLERVAP